MDKNLKNFDPGVQKHFLKNSQSFPATQEGGIFAPFKNLTFFLLLGGKYPPVYHAD